MTWEQSLFKYILMCLDDSADKNSENNVIYSTTIFETFAFLSPKVWLFENGQKDQNCSQTALQK